MRHGFAFAPLDAGGMRRNMLASEVYIRAGSRGGAVFCMGRTREKEQVLGGERALFVLCKFSGHEFYLAGVCTRARYFSEKVREIAGIRGTRYITLVLFWKNKNVGRSEVSLLRNAKLVVSTVLLINYGGKVPVSRVLRLYVNEILVRLECINK